MPKWTRVFDQRFGGDDADARLDAAAFHRNVEPILAVLETELAGVEGDIVEIGSGTGQHVVAFAETFPRITWWPTDYEADHVTSIEAWRRHAGLGNIMPAVQLDAAGPWRFPGSVQPPLSNLAAIVSLNVIHISPWPVGEGILRGAGAHLRTGGKLVFYGPFKRDGAHTAESNARFDQSLRGRDPSWGVRDMADVERAAVANGLHLERIHQMPANNFILIFVKD